MKSQIYDAFIQELLSNGVGLSKVTLQAALLSPDYIADPASQSRWSQVMSYEIQDPSYSRLTLQNVTVEKVNGKYLIQAKPLAWKSLSATFRHIVLFLAKDATGKRYSNPLLIADYDLECNQHVDAATFKVEWGDEGLFSLKV